MIRGYQFKFTGEDATVTWVTIDLLQLPDQRYEMAVSVALTHVIKTKGADWLHTATRDDYPFN
jgi:hypothetical protein